MPAKFDRCVDKVKASGDNVNAYAVCHSSIEAETIEELASEGREIYEASLDKTDAPSILQEHHSPLDLIGDELHDEYQEGGPGSGRKSEGDGKQSKLSKAGGFIKGWAGVGKDAAKLGGSIAKDKIKDFAGFGINDTISPDLNQISIGDKKRIQELEKIIESAR